MGQSPSQKLEDRYYLQKIQLYQDSSSAVWRAVDRKKEFGDQDNQVAIKRIGKIQGAHIQHELSLLHSCKHENIIKAYDKYEDSDKIYLVLEYCGDGDFADKVKERGADVTEGEAASWTRQIIAAVEALHMKNICHRNIKPENFLLAKGILKLSDFKYAVSLPAGNTLSEKCGAPEFMAPEQHSSRGYGLPVDVWAAGVVMYMVLCGGKHPFIHHNSLDKTRLLKGELGFSEGFFAFMGGRRKKRFSNLAVELCRCLVKPSVGDRMTASAALRNPWFLQADAEQSELSPESSSEEHPVWLPKETTAIQGLRWPQRATSNNRWSCAPRDWIPSRFSREMCGGQSNWIR